jgi:hypothetical protein
MFLELAGAFVATTTLVPSADRLHTIARPHALGSAVALNILVGLNGLVALDRSGRLNRLVILDVGGLARLDALNVFAALDSKVFAALPALNALRAFAELHRAGLWPPQGLDALDVPHADIAELPLKVGILERYSAVRSVEFPGLELPGVGRDGDSVKFAVENVIGLNSGVTGMSPVVPVP